MLKTRIIPTLLYKDPTLVKGRKFNSWRRVSSAIQSIKLFNLREVDELIFLDIMASKENQDPDYYLIDDIADDCFMPLTIGGGIKNIDHVEKLLKVGADKISINSEIHSNIDLISEIANYFGSQCVVVSIDAKKNIDGTYCTFKNAGTEKCEMSPFDLAKLAEEKGAGEILINSLDQDGTMEGFDTSLIKQVSEMVTIPVIAAGGAGSIEDCVNILKDTKANAISAASIFHFTEITPKEIKGRMAQEGFPVRI